MELSEKEKRGQVSLVSVITPSFNSGRFITTCIEGVVKQCVPGMSVEHIIIDNNSTDETIVIIKDVIDNMAGAYKINFMSEPDNGHHEAISKGIMLAKSPYVAVCNTSDYYAYERWLADAIYYIGKYKVDCIWGMNYNVDEDYENCYDADHVGAIRGVPFSYKPYGIKDYIIHSVGFSEVTAVFRREVIQSIMPMKRPQHPWLFIQYDFFTSGFTSMFIPVIAAVTRKHKDSLATQNGEGVERKAFAEIAYLIDIYRRSHFASLAD